LNIDFDTTFRAERKFKMSDIEVVALSLIAEYMSIKSESALFKQLNNSPIHNLIERIQFNKKRKRLFEFPSMLE